MTLTGMVGVLAVFATAFLNLVYISHLGRPELTAAMGFGNAVIAVQIAVSIGMAIAIGATTAQHIGAGHYDVARDSASSFLLVMGGALSALGFGTALFSGPILHLLGARGEVFHQAQIFLVLSSCSLPLMALVMGLSSLLRAVGDARRAMNVTLFGAAAGILVDPVLIFGLHAGIVGAAGGTICARIVSTSLGLWWVRRHELLRWPDLRRVPYYSWQCGSIALPAILTNLATPAGSLYITHSMALFGVAAVTGQTTIDQVTQIAFSFVFALTGSIGPILAQNRGAGLRERMVQTMRVSLGLTCLCVLVVWACAALLQDEIVAVFGARGETAELIRLFCSWVIVGNVFVGMLFVANAAFNNLGNPLLSTLFNWGRALFGVVPFVWIGCHYGPHGVIIGQIFSAAPFGIAAVVVAFWVVRRTPVGDLPLPQDKAAHKT